MANVSNDLIIEDPLAWQKRIDDSGLVLNTRGCSRFWETVKSLLNDRWVGVDGSPDVTEVIIELEHGLGLRLFTETLDVATDYGGVTPLIRYEFVSLEQDGA